MKFNGSTDFVTIKRAKFLNRKLSSTEIATLYQYERWFFRPWYKKIILLPEHIYLYFKHFNLLSS